LSEIELIFFTIHPYKIYTFAPLFENGPGPGLPSSSKYFNWEKNCFHRSIISM